MHMTCKNVVGQWLWLSVKDGSLACLGSATHIQQAERSCIHVACSVAPLQPLTNVNSTSITGRAD